MKVHSKWVGASISLVVVVSMALIGFTTTARAAATAKGVSSTHAAKHSSAGIPKRCKTRTKAKGQEIYSDVQFPDTLAPDQTTLAVTVETLNAMFDSLLPFNNNAKQFADILTRVPSTKNGDLSKDGKTVTFHFKKGLVWSDGKTEITSADLKFGWAIDKDPSSGPYCDAGCKVISRIDTPDKYTAVMHLKNVDAPFIAAGHYPEIWPTKWTASGCSWNNDSAAAAKAIWSQSTCNWEDKTYPTSGPYQVDSFSNNDRIVLSANPHYDILNCGAHVSKLIFSFYSDNEAMIAAAAKHDTNLTQDYLLTSAKELQTHKSDFKTLIAPGFIVEHLELNQDATYQGSKNPMNNVKVRQAVALGVDKLTVLQSALNINLATAKSIVGYSFLVDAPALRQPFADPKLLGQWDPLTKKYESSGSATAVKDAKKLLASAGYGSGFKADFQTTTSSARIAEQSAICASLQKINVTCNSQQTPATTLFGQWDKNGTLDHGSFQIALFAFLVSPDPDGIKTSLEGQFVDRTQTVHSSVNGNYAGVHDSKIDADFTKGAATLDNKVRTKYYKDAQLRVNQNADWVVMYYRPTIATTDGHVKNVTDNPTTTGPTWNVWAWHL